MPSGISVVSVSHHHCPLVMFTTMASPPARTCGHSRSEATATAIPTATIAHSSSVRVLLTDGPGAGPSVARTWRRMTASAAAISTRVAIRIVICITHSPRWFLPFDKKTHYKCQFKFVLGMQIYVWYIDAMQLSKFSDYALRILVHLAASPDRLLSTRQLAELHDAKYNHLAKVAGWLVQQGYAEGGARPRRRFAPCPRPVGNQFGKNPPRLGG